MNLLVATSLSFLLNLIPSGNQEIREEMRNGIRNLKTPSEELKKHIQKIIGDESESVVHALENFVAVYLQEDDRGLPTSRRVREKYFLESLEECLTNSFSDECTDRKRNLCHHRGKQCKLAQDAFFQEVNKLTNENKKKLLSFFKSKTGVNDVKGYFVLYAAISVLVIAIGSVALYAIWTIWGTLSWMYSLGSGATEKFKQAVELLKRPLSSILPSSFPSIWYPDDNPPAPDIPYVDPLFLEYERKRRESRIRRERHKHLPHRLEDMSALENLRVLLDGSMGWGSCLSGVVQVLESLGCVKPNDERIWSKLSIWDLFYCLTLLLNKTLGNSGPILVGGVILWVLIILVSMLLPAAIGYGLFLGAKSLCKDLTPAGCIFAAVSNIGSVVTFLGGHLALFGKTIASGIGTALTGGEVSTSASLPEEQSMGRGLNGGMNVYERNQMSLEDQQFVTQNLFRGDLNQLNENNHRRQTLAMEDDPEFMAVFGR